MLKSASFALADVDTRVLSAVEANLYAAITIISLEISYGFRSSNTHGSAISHSTTIHLLN